MKNLTLLPYLGLQDEINLGNGIKIWNFNKYKNSYITDDIDRLLAEKLVSMFEKQEWVNIVMQNGKVFKKLTGKALQKIELLLFAASISSGNVRASILGNDDSSSTAENFTFFSFNLDDAMLPEINHSGNLVTRLTHNKSLLVAKGSIYTPLYVSNRTVDNTKFDIELVKAINRLAKENKEMCAKVFRSLEMLFLTVSNNPIIPHLDHIIMGGAAFENLLGKGRVNVKNKIDEIFKGNRLCISYFRNRNGIKELEIDYPRRTSHAIWYDNFYSTRNIATHGLKLETKDIDILLC